MNHMKKDIHSQILDLSDDISKLTDNQDIPGLLDKKLSQIPGIDFVSLYLNHHYYSSHTDDRLNTKTCRELFDYLKYKSGNQRALNKSLTLFKEKTTLEYHQIKTQRHLYGILFIQYKGSGESHNQRELIGHVIDVTALVIENNTSLKLLNKNRINLYQSDEETDKIESRLLQAQKMEAIGTLGGGIAHDFNNILGGSRGISELLQEDLYELECPDTIQNNLSYIMQGAIRAKDLVSQILAFSRSGDDELQPISITLHAKEVVKLLRASLPSTITIRQSFTTNSLVLADATKIHQIFMNLSTNAGYAMNETGGDLTLSLSDVRVDEKQVVMHDQAEQGDYICLSVKDTGHGMSSDLIDKIMEPFFTTKPKEKGTGMGLWVVHGIVKSMNGFIEITSKTGKGSCFDVYLPVCPAATDPVVLHPERKVSFRGGE